MQILQGTNTNPAQIQQLQSLLQQTHRNQSRSSRKETKKEKKEGESSTSLPKPNVATPATPTTPATSATKSGAATPSTGVRRSLKNISFFGENSKNFITLTDKFSGISGKLAWRFYSIF